MCVCTATTRLFKNKFSVKAEILFPFVTRTSSLKRLCHSWELGVLLTQNTNWGVESGIVGRSQGAPVWPPVTSRSCMLIMEPVNANDENTASPQELRMDVRQE